ncbi:MAG TPA: ATP-binding protein, partial [bacterium]|nr:ATP-binding protein [bacterium]
MPKDRWLPVGLSLPDGVRLRALLHAGPSWQIYQTDPPGRVFVAEPPLVSRWVSTRLMEEGLFSSIPFGSDEYSVMCSNESHTLAPIAESSSPGSKAEALSMAAALRETRKIAPDAPLQDAIFVEQYSRLLPTWSITERVPDDIVLGAWLTGGVAVSVLSFRRLSQLMGWMSPEHLRDIVTAAGFALPRDQTVGIPGTRSLSSL